jgi:hypothetical protein
MVLKDVFQSSSPSREFKIGKSIIVILGRMKINISIAGKVIGKAVVTAMAIKENKLRLIVKEFSALLKALC